MYTYKYGGKKGAEVQLDIADDLLVVRTRKNKSLPDAIASVKGKNVLTRLLPVCLYCSPGFIRQPAAALERSERYLAPGRGSNRSDRW